MLREWKGRGERSMNRFPGGGLKSQPRPDLDLNQRPFSPQDDTPTRARTKRILLYPVERKRDKKKKERKGNKNKV